MGGDEGGGDRGEQSELGWDFHGDNHCTVCAAALVPWVGAFSRARSDRSCVGSPSAGRQKRQKACDW
jgi:hypothetical protein